MAPPRQSVDWSQPQHRRAGLPLYRLGLVCAPMLLFDAIAGRRGFALALILLVAVGGYLRGMVVSEAFAEPPGFTLCHGAAGGTPAGDAVNHSCCDDCVLAAFAVEPAPTTLSLPAEVFADA